MYEKKSSSKWIKTKGVHYRNLYWQEGYGGFSVSKSGVDAVRRYILNQKKHHEKVSFMDEYKNLFEEYGIPYKKDISELFITPTTELKSICWSSNIGLRPTL